MHLRRIRASLTKRRRPGTALALSVLVAFCLATVACSSARTPAAAAGASAVGTSPNGSVLPDMGAAPALDLTDARTGSRLGPEIARKIVLVSFVTTTCREACPVVESKFVAVQEKLARDGYLGPRIALVLVGLDAVEDTRASLNALATRLGVRSAGFHFATGDARTLGRVLDGFGIAVVRHDGSHVDPDHTVAIYLIDKRRRIRNEFAAYDSSAVIARAMEQVAG